MRNRIFIKCIVIAVAAVSTVALFAFRSAPTSRAESDATLSEISKYKTWKKVNEKPVEARPMTSTPSSNSSKEPVVIAEPEGG